MGKVWSTILRPIKIFNIDNRARRILDKNLPVRAPRFKSDEENLNKVLKEHPEIIEEYSKKHESLDDYLKQIYVTSTNPEKIIQTGRKLPQNKSYVEESEYGVEVPDVIPRGRLTLISVLKMLEEHIVDKKPPKELSRDYQIKQEFTDNILRYYNILEMRFPKVDKSYQDIPVQELTHEKLTGKPKAFFEEEIKKLEEKRKQNPPPEEKHEEILKEQKRILEQAVEKREETLKEQKRIIEQAVEKREKALKKHFGEKNAEDSEFDNKIRN